eukprot:75906-Alexandrium_andersonii.AAC.1
MDNGGAAMLEHTTLTMAWQDCPATIWLHATSRCACKVSERTQALVNDEHSVCAVSYTHLRAHETSAHL